MSVAPPTSLPPRSSSASSAASLLEERVIATNGAQYGVARGSPPIRSSATTMIGSLSVEAPSNSAPAFQAPAWPPGLCTYTATAGVVRAASDPRSRSSRRWSWAGATGRSEPGGSP